MTTPQWTCIACLLLLCLGATSASRVIIDKKDKEIDKQESSLLREQKNGQQLADCQPGGGNCDNQSGGYGISWGQGDDSGDDTVGGGNDSPPGFVIPGIIDFIPGLIIPGLSFPGFGGIIGTAGLYCRILTDGGTYCTEVDCSGNHCKGVRLYFDIHDHHTSVEAINGGKQSTNHEKEDAHIMDAMAPESG